MSYNINIDGNNNSSKLLLQSENGTIAETNNDDKIVKQPMQLAYR